MGRAQQIPKGPKKRMRSTIVIMPSVFISYARIGIFGLPQKGHGPIGGTSTTNTTGGAAVITSANHEFVMLCNALQFNILSSCPVNAKRTGSVSHTWDKLDFNDFWK